MDRVVITGYRLDISHTWMNLPKFCKTSTKLGWTLAKFDLTQSTSHKRVWRDYHHIKLINTCCLKVFFFSKICVRIRDSINLGGNKKKKLIKNRSSMAHKLVITTLCCVSSTCHVIFTRVYQIIGIRCKFLLKSQKAQD